MKSQPPFTFKAEAEFTCKKWEAVLVDKQHRVLFVNMMNSLNYELRQLSGKMCEQKV